ncbi:MAG TPA: hypothetical protein VFK94_01465 [Patescibacteria group bacterium]|nr:hypothetical protein [Patescibacteria group bacterium]
MIPEASTEPKRFGSAAWEKVPPALQEKLAPLLVDNTDSADRTVRAGWSEGKPVYRASMAGRCLKELYLWRVGAGGTFGETEDQRDEYRDKGLLAANEGQLHEPLMVEALRREGFEITNAGDDQDQLEARYKRFVVRSHPDGLIRGMELGPQWRVLECKALNQDRFEMWRSMGWDAFRNYAFQVSLEMYLATKKYGVPVLGLFVVKNRNTGETLRTLVDNYPVDPAFIINRFSMIENAVEAENYMPNCDPEAEWFFCPFLGKGQCDAVKGPKGEIQIVEDPELVETLKEFKGIKAAIAELEARESALKAFIKEHMVLGPAISVGSFFAKLSERTRRGFDIPGAKAWIEAHGGNVSEFDKETSYVELRVTGGLENDKPGSSD